MAGNSNGNVAWSRVVLTVGAAFALASSGCADIADSLGWDDGKAGGRLDRVQSAGEVQRANEPGHVPPEGTAVEAVNSRDAAVAAAQPVIQYRPRDPNPLAYTREGGRPGDDPAPQKLSDTAKGRLTATIQVTGLPDASLNSYIQNRLQEATSSRGIGSSYSKVLGQEPRNEYRLTGIDDLEALSLIIDFGTVTSIDQSMRTIHVAANSKMLPEPRRMISDVNPLFRSVFNAGKVNLPNGGSISTGIDTSRLQNIPNVSETFTQDELIDALTHWDRTSRRNACIEICRLKTVKVEELPRLKDAVRIRLDDIDSGVRSEAQKTLAAMDKARPVPPPGSEPAAPAAPTVVIEIHNDVPLEIALTLSNDLRRWTGASGVQYSSRTTVNQNVTEKITLVTLTGPKDPDAVLARLTMFDVEGYRLPSKTIHVKLKPDTAALLSETINRQLLDESIAAPDAPRLSDLLTQAGDDDTIAEPITFKAFGFIRGHLGALGLLRKGTAAKVNFNTEGGSLAMTVDLRDVGDTHLNWVVDEVELEQEGSTLVCHSPVSFAGHKALLTKKRHVPADGDRWVTWRLGVVLPDLQITFAARCRDTDDRRLESTFDAMLLNVEEKFIESGL